MKMSDAGVGVGNVFQGANKDVLSIKKEDENELVLLFISQLKTHFVITMDVF